MKQPTKAQKLKWVRAARLSVASATLQGFAGFTCLAFAWLSDNGFGKAEGWYCDTTLSLMEEKRYEPLMPTDFEGDSSGGASRNPHRELWLAMLETLIEAGEI